MDSELENRIRLDNRRMHDAAGYASFYDQQVSLIRNPWEQRRFRDDLAAIARRLPRAFRALDLGCGTGNLTLKIAALGGRVTGIDLSTNMLERLRRKLDAASFQSNLIVEDVDRYLAQCTDQFDLVCACSFLHHMPDYVKTSAAAARRVAPGGCLYFVHEPLAFAEADALGRIIEWVDFRWQRVEARTGIGGRAARDDPYYDRESLADYWAINRGLDPAAIERVLRSTGLAPRTIRYDSKRHRLMHMVAQWLGTQHLVRVLAWRAHGRP